MVGVQRGVLVVIAAAALAHHVDSMHVSYAIWNI